MRDGKVCTPDRGGRMVVVAAVLAGMIAISAAGLSDEGLRQVHDVQQVAKTFTLP
ncbi:hypothetical protein [Lentzea sp. NBRC 105346]|uniref:hypothetical protein n=1 Tax=Lentzea sp. NBRC 105346 TaxID=3032205 RepID=UPI0025546C45|nr:hypothetical protein [Lentzea sp. NBRC 105346]